MGRIASTVAVACVVVLGAVATTAAQGPETAKPGPEAQRLASFAGSWQDETNVPQNQFGPGGKEKGTSACEWFTGNFQIVCRGESKGSAGTSATMIIIGWHPGQKAYLAQVIDSNGAISQLKGTVTGNTWTFTSEGPPPMPMPGVTTGRFRMTIVDVSPTEQTAKGEISLDGKPWMVVMEGKSTKVK